jgi:hypothetical protein
LEVDGQDFFHPVNPVNNSNGLRFPAFVTLVCFCEKRFLIDNGFHYWSFGLMKFRIAFLVHVAVCGCLGAAAAGLTVGPPQRVNILGYDDHAMEPFISRDGRYLLFNNLNQPTTNTDIHFAERQDDFTWLYRGRVDGVNTPDLEGCPSMDSAGQMYFVSTRNYSNTLCTIYTGGFEAGRVSEVQAVESVSLKQPGVVNFDVDVSPDGKMLIYVNSRFTPGGDIRSADLVMAYWDGAQFVRSPDSARILRRVNTAGWEYAPTISSNKLTLYFTRYAPLRGCTGPQIYRATRRVAGVPFGRPMRVQGLGDFVEGTAFSVDEQLLYFHRKDGDKFNLYAVSLH